jgi:hypothetical protein
MSKKKLDNMTMDERIAYWEKEQKKEMDARQVIVDQLTPAMLDALTKLHKYALSVSCEALHGGGVRYIYCDDFNELYDAAETVRRLFNMDVK